MGTVACRETLKAVAVFLAAARFWPRRESKAQNWARRLSHTKSDQWEPPADSGESLSFIGTKTRSFSARLRLARSP